MQLSRGCVVVSIQVELNEETLVRLQNDLMAVVGASGAQGVVLDLGGIEVMDGQEFTALLSTMSMARVMGATPILSGLRPGVVSALVDFDVNLEGLIAARDLDDAFDRLGERGLVEAGRASAPAP